MIQISQEVVKKLLVTNNRDDVFYRHQNLNWGMNYPPPTLLELFLEKFIVEGGRGEI